MMKIGIIGYGKMGKEIEKILKSRNHDVAGIADDEAGLEKIKGADVVIDFSVPSAAVKNMEFCFSNNIPVVQGTTGWYDNFERVTALCMEKNATLLYATNFSIGVNIFFMVNEFLANLMNDQGNYDVNVFESHHTQKLDAPSGTAVTLTEGILKNLERRGKWQEFEKGAVPQGLEKEVIPVEYTREEGVVGFHEVTYTSEIDKLKITHEAFNRQGFALGAVIAAEWVANKKGVFTMRDLLKDLNK